MKRILAALLLSAFAATPPLRSAEDGRDEPCAEALQQVGEMVDCVIHSQRIELPPGARSVLRVEKNGKETVRVSLEGVRELVVVRCQGSGMGVSPRSPELGEGMQIRVIARKRDGHDVFSVSYTIPAGTRHSVVGETAVLPTLYSRRDMSEGDRKQLGNLILTVEKAEDGGGGPPDARSEPE